MNPNNQTNTTNVPLEEPKEVNRKGNLAIKHLANKIATVYQSKQAPKPVEPPLKDRADATLQALSYGIGKKYEFQKKQEEQAKPVVVVPSQPVMRPSNVIDLKKDEGVFHQNIVNKNFEVIVEKPIVREVYVDKPYEVIVERPVENRIEKEVVIERFIDNPIEKIIEKEVEKVVHRRVEQIEERPIIYEKVYENRIENIVEKEVQINITKDVPRTKYVDKEIRRTILKPYRKEIQTKEVIVEEPVYYDEIVEIPHERIIEKYVDVPIAEYVDKEYTKEVIVNIKQDRYVQKRVEVPYDKIIDIPEIKKVKKSYTIQKIVNKEIERIVEKEVPVTRVETQKVDKIYYVDKVVKKPIERIVEKPYYVNKRVEVQQDIEVDKEIVIDKYVDIEVEQILEVPIEREKIVEVPVEKRVAKYVEVPMERFVDIRVEREVIIPVEKIVERHIQVDRRVPRIVEREKLIEVPVSKYVDKIVTVDKIVEKPVYVEKIVEKPVERYIEKRVEVIVEKFVEVPTEIRRDKIIEVETIVDKPVYIERYVDDNTEMILTTKNDKLNREYQSNLSHMEQLKSERQQLLMLIEQRKLRFKMAEMGAHVVEKVTGYEENRVLRTKLDQLHDEYNGLIDAKNHEVVEGYRQGPRKSGYGQTRVLQNNTQQQEKIKNTSNIIRTSSYMNQNKDQYVLDSNGQVIKQTQRVSYNNQGFGQGGQVINGQYIVNGQVMGNVVTGNQTQYQNNTNQYHNTSNGYQNITTNTNTHVVSGNGGHVVSSRRGLEENVFESRLSGKKLGRISRAIGDNVERLLQMN